MNRSLQAVGVRFAVGMGAFYVAVMRPYEALVHPFDLILAVASGMVIGHAIAGWAVKG